MGADAEAELQTRTATLDDAESIASLGADAFVAAFGPSNPADVVAEYVADAFAPARVAEQIADPGATWVIAEHDGVVVGFAHLQLDQAPPEVTGRLPIRLARFYARPDRIGTGVGRALMLRCLDVANEHGCDVAWLGVWEHNSRAIAFYQRWGFTEVGAETFRLGDDDQTDLVFQRRIDTA